TLLNTDIFCCLNIQYLSPPHDIRHLRLSLSARVMSGMRGRLSRASILSANPVNCIVFDVANPAINIKALVYTQPFPCPKW
ncbi:MAG: hypothetical protein JSW12_13700, partial [Deltaproteobacteria bacterium]